ncbi:hypothetical protein L6452_30521 [Arctium lappa]|uniref:Uncharacterized protein n=1 Tax=Arctium lappa TaxID=4217 RepID=A0ACB8ZJP2_ARCLA|nr:hypothetical protein L6452_30521 [Arctium lappa]
MGRTKNGESEDRVGNVDVDSCGAKMSAVARSLKIEVTMQLKNERSWTSLPSFRPGILTVVRLLEVQRVCGSL